jgi:hypothetical protein
VALAFFQVVKILPDEEAPCAMQLRQRSLVVKSSGLHLGENGSVPQLDHEH